MKRRILTSLLLAVSMVSGCGALSACASSPKNVYLEKGDRYFTKTPYVDLSNIPEKISFKVDIEENILDISIGRILIYEEDFDYRDGILSINSDVLKDENGKLLIASGDNRFGIRVEGKMIYQDCFMVDKVINTPDDLQDINNRPMGSYILGKDIDLSGVSNFEPLGYSESDSHYNQEFGGIFDGNGFAIKNISTKYSLHPESTEEQYHGRGYVFEDESHREGTEFGVFQNIGPSGVVRNVSFMNCDIVGKTIVGVVAGTCNGIIENVFIDKDCSAVASTHFYDDDCNVGGIVGLQGKGEIRNVISLAKAEILPQFTDFDEESYDNPETEDVVEVSHIFYNGDKGWTDSNGLVTTGVYAGIGKSWATASNCVALAFNEGAYGIRPFGQTHLAVNKESSGNEDMGHFINCVVKTEDEMKSSSLYSSFSTEIWNIVEGGIPTFRNPYPTAIY